MKRDPWASASLQEAYRYEQRRAWLWRWLMWAAFAVLFGMTLFLRGH